MSPVRSPQCGARRRDGARGDGTGLAFVDAFRDEGLGRGLLRTIAEEVAALPPERLGSGGRLNLMEFCGGHTHAIARYGLADLLPPRVRLIHGPGCPVCVLPTGRLDMAQALARDPRVILCTYGDMMRVPGSDGQTLQALRGTGADVRMVYSSLDALAIAKAHPGREVVFFAIGFETTTPPTAIAVQEARAQGLGNVSVLCNHVLTPAALTAILELAPDSDSDSDDDAQPPPTLDGIIGPAHVSTVIGAAPYAPVARDHGLPVVIAGFEPLDILQAVLMLIRQIAEGRAAVEIQYSRAVTWEGNTKAQALVAEMFETRESFEWRGLGRVPASALRFRAAFADQDAERRFALIEPPSREPPGCRCGAVLRGALEPADCPLFGRACTPDTPVGACMVSAEGACAAAWTSRRSGPEPGPDTESVHVSRPKG